MAVIANKMQPSKAAVLPLGPVVYSRQYQDQLNNILRLYFAQVDSVTQILATNTGGRFIGSPYGEYLDTTNQVAGSTTAAYAMRFNTTARVNGMKMVPRTASFAGSIATTTLTVTTIIPGNVIYLGMEIAGTGVTAGTRIITFVSGTGGVGTYTVNISQTVASTAMTGNLPSQMTSEYPGVYNIQLSAQFINSSGAAVDVDVWFRRNGVNEPYTNSVYTVPANGKLIAVFNFFLELISADIVEIMWHTASTSTYLGYTAAGVSPARPATPSIIATMNFVSSIPA